MEIVVDYAKAYLTIMNKQQWVKTLYFDGFAGSGLIDSSDKEEAIKGTALRILGISQPRPFDIYIILLKKTKKIRPHLRERLSMTTILERIYTLSKTIVIKS